MKRFLTGLTLAVLTAIQAHALIIGTSKNYPPFSSLADQNNHFSGFDIDIMQAICKRIKMPCTYTSILMSDVTTDLVAGKIDLAISAIVIPDTPSPYFLYSLPYLPSYAQFVVNSNSEIKTPSDVDNELIGTRTELVYTQLIKKLSNSKARIAGYPDLNMLMHALLTKKIDVVLTNAAAIHYWMASGGGEYRLVGNPIAIGNGYGIMAYQDQDALIEKINQAIQEMMNDGSYARIYSTYFAE